METITMLETTTTPSTELHQDDPMEEQKKQNVLSAVALGWSLFELLGRCFTLQLPTPEKQLENKGWHGENMEIISPALNSQKRLKALVYFIHTLVKKLELNDSDMNKLIKEVEEFCDLDPASCPNIKEEINKQRGQINRFIFLWDMKIREELQNKCERLLNTYDYVNAYMIGKSFAALRWYLPEEQNGTKKIFDERYLEMLEEHVQLMAPYLYKFAPLALANSLKDWRASILKRELCHSNGEVSLALQHQADIWYVLLTAARDPITYVTPSAVKWRYMLGIVLFSLPYIILSILLVLAITALFAFLMAALWLPIARAFNIDQVVTSTIAAVGTGFSLLAGIGTTLPIVKVLWQLVTQKMRTWTEQSAETKLNDTGRSLIDMFWEAAQQEAIHKATCVKHKKMFSK